MFTTKNADAAAGHQIGGINAGYGQASGLMGQGRDALQQNYASGLQPFQQNFQQSQGGTTAYGNAMGLNGPEGNKAATTAFWNNPAIQSQLDIGDQNVMRNQSATGQLNSGKTNVDLQKFGQQTASQGWGDYINRLSPYFNQANTAAQGIGGLYSGLGNQLNQSFGKQGDAAYGAQTSIGNAQANQDMAGNNASANIWGTGLGLASAAMGGGGMFGSFGGNTTPGAGVPQEGTGFAGGLRNLFGGFR